MYFHSRAASRKTILGYAIGIPAVHKNLAIVASDICDLIHQVEPQGALRLVEEAASVQTLSGIPEDYTLDSSFVQL